MKYIKLFEGFVNESKYTRYAQTDEQEDVIRVVEGWLKKMGKSVVGGTTIGKHPQTVILDITHHGSEIYISSGGWEGTPSRRGDENFPGLEVNGVHVESDADFDVFKEAIEKRD